MPQLILVRHGESEWNRANRFTGWADVGLTERGRSDMYDAGVRLRREGIAVDLGLTSVLSRSILSHVALLAGMGRLWAPSTSHWRLNERRYGSLTGLSKNAAVSLYGADAVQRWRRSIDAAPPDGGNNWRGNPIHDARYTEVPPGEISCGESLVQVVERVRPVWQGCIAPALRSEQRVLVTAHGNSMRALMKLIEHIADDEIALVEVPNAIPIVYQLDQALRVVGKTSYGTSASPPSEIL